MNAGQRVQTFILIAFFFSFLQISPNELGKGDIMTLKEFAEILDIVAPLPEPEPAPEWLLHELNIRLDEPELIWS